MSILALLSGGFVVSLVGKHQRKESNSNATESDAPKQGVSETHTS